jgi:hypothetical protein
MLKTTFAASTMSGAKINISTSGISAAPQQSPKIVGIRASPFILRLRIRSAQDERTFTEHRSW